MEGLCVTLAVRYEILYTWSSNSEHPARTKEKLCQIVQSENRACRTHLTQGHTVWWCFRLRQPMAAIDVKLFVAIPFRRFSAHGQTDQAKTTFGKSSTSLQAYSFCLVIDSWSNGVAWEKISAWISVLNPLVDSKNFPRAKSYFRGSFCREQLMQARHQKHWHANLLWLWAWFTQILHLPSMRRVRRRVH